MDQIRKRMKKLKQKQKQKGFTLVELIVVIAIIGILAGVMLPKYFAFTDDARKGVAISEAKSIRTIAETYYAKNGEWPDASSASSGFHLTGDTTEFSGTLDDATLTNGSFVYTKNNMEATCAEDGTVTDTTTS